MRQLLAGTGKDNIAADYCACHCKLSLCFTSWCFRVSALFALGSRAGQSMYSGFRASVLCSLLPWSPIYSGGIVESILYRCMLNQVQRIDSDMMLINARGRMNANHHPDL